MPICERLTVSMRWSVRNGGLIDLTMVNVELAKPQRFHHPDGHP